MDVTKRVQVAPLGYEYERVLEPIYKYRADEVILLRQLADQDYEAEFQRDLVETLRENDRIDLETYECDLFDLDSALEAFVTAIESRPDDDVLVNVATGSKITAIAGMMACQTTAATPFYVTPRFQTEDGTPEPPQEPLVDAVGEIFDLPVFDVEKPSADQLAILAHLRDNGGATKKELITYAREHELAFIANSESKSQEGLYRLLETNVIGPLTEQDYVRVEKDGRTKRVYLDTRGQEALRVFPQPSTQQ